MRRLDLAWTSGVLALATAGGVAQEPLAGLASLRQACLDAATDAVVLNVAAHPDDESSRTNVVLRRRWGLRVVTVYATYGDGGQNAIGREIGPELAGLRVRETIRAATISDVRVRWLGMEDFGFSKTLEETLRVWGEDRLRDAMSALLDEVDPDLIITNHNPTQGHGHHRASYWATVEALKLRAANGGRQVPLYARSGVRDAHFAVDPGEIDPFRGETYARQAHRSWTQHVTQGPWGPHNPLQVGKDFWRQVFPENADALTAGSPQLQLRSAFDQEAMVTACRARGLDPAALAADLQAFLEDRPVADHAGRARRLLPDLLRLREALHESHTPAAARALRRLDRRIDAVQRILLAAVGLHVEVWLQRDEVAVGSRGQAYVMVHGAERVSDLQVRCAGVVAEPVQAPVRSRGPASPAGTASGTESAGGRDGTADPALPAPPAGRYQVSFAPEGTPGEGLPPTGPETAWVVVDVSFTLDGLPIQLHPELPYTAVPAVDLEWDREAVMVPRGQQVERLLSAVVQNHADESLTQALRLSMGVGVRAEALPARIDLTRENPEARILVRASFDGQELTPGSELRLEAGGQRAAVRIVPVDVFVPPGLKVGLVRGPDDTLERALSDLGIAYTALSRDDLAVVRLEEFGSLLLDIRAYHHRPELAEVRDRILQYCRAGGRVVAMYHKPGEWNERAGHPLLAPFPLNVGNDRVTEEDSGVTLLQPDHRVWTHPHRITAEDFDGWVQERGLNFPRRWDAAWTPLLEMKDSGDEEPNKGALLYTQYGRGDFVYCSLVLYRQLRIGHAGAARMLVNMLSR